MASSECPKLNKELVKSAVQANKDHQNALKEHTDRLEAELKNLDKLLAIVDYDSDQEDAHESQSGGSIFIPGLTKATPPLPISDLQSEESLFFEQEDKRLKFISMVCSRPMKPKEIEVLVDAVKAENYRRHAYQSQKTIAGKIPLPSLKDEDAEKNTTGLDWERIAQKVSAISCAPRAPRELEIFWLADRHPDNNNSTWSPAEIAQLKLKVSGLPHPVDWVKVASELGTRRSPIDCMRHASTKKVHSWNNAADTRLLEAIEKFGHENWNLVARYVSEDATAVQCQARYIRTLDPNLKHSPWTAAEDAMLKIAYEIYGNSWVEVSSLLPGRHNDQCRERWADTIAQGKGRKGKWSEEEDERLLEAVGELGEGRWAEISEAVLGEKTASMCRVRYEGLRKQKKQKGKERQNECVSDNRPSSSQPIGDVTAQLANETVEVPARPRPKPKPRNKGKGKEKETVSQAESSTVPGGDEKRDGPPPKKRRGNVQENASVGSEALNQDVAESTGLDQETNGDGTQAIDGNSVRPKTKKKHKAVAEPTRRQPKRTKDKKR